MPYTNDDNANNTYTVDYKLSSEPTIWTNWVTGAAHTASPYTTTIAGLTGGETYDVRCTYNDVDGVNGTNPQTISGISTAPTRYVDDDGLCGGQTPCDTAIQTAIDALGVSTVIVYAGTYNENITMKDGVDVVNNPGDTPIINGGGFTSAVTFSGAFTAGSTLDGFDISGTTTYPGVYVHGAGAGIDNSTTIKNCFIHGNDGPGIELDGADATTAPTIDDNEIYSNVQEGIYIRNAGSVSEDAIILNNTIRNNTLAGINIGGTSYVTIGDNNDIYSNGDAGIASGDAGDDLLLSSSSITIKGNTVGGSGQANGGAGIYLKGSGSGIQVTIGGSLAGDSNTIYYNTGEGISLEDIDQASIENNEISNNSWEGILLVDVSTVAPHIKSNNIHDHYSRHGISIGGASGVTIGDNNNISYNRTGVAFDTSNANPSSQPVTIKGNVIDHSSYAGILVRDAITGTVTITEQNDIRQNSTAGISIQNSCQLEITKNEIRDNVLGGIHTGTYLANGGGFYGSMGSAVLTIRHNKVHNNGGSGYGGGIDVRHASGTIENNLVYKNHRGGIRFGWENAADPHITDIKNNTVVNNGNALDDKGGGIIYDNLSGAVNDAPAGDLLLIGKINIRNNICAYNQKAGLRACFTNTEGSEERDYNLVYSNHPPYKPDCGWLLPDSLEMRCVNKQYGGCGAHWDYSQPYPVVMNDPNDIMDDPLFVDEGIDDYHLQVGSPAEDTGDDGYDMGAYGGSDPINW
jgi:parallel beta-helix repeat protein